MEELEEMIISMGFILHIQCGYSKQYKFIKDRNNKCTIKLWGSHNHNLNTVLSIILDNDGDCLEWMIFDNYVEEFYDTLVKYKQLNLFVRKFKIALLNG